VSATEVVERYLGLIADHGSDPAELAALLHDDFRFVERPNLVSPSGSDRDREAVLRSLAAGRELLSSERYEVRDHLVSGDRIVTRVVWTGTVARDAGPFAAGAELRAESSMHFVVRGGLIVEQENFDCFHAFGPRA
jgi:ketosteroid isomerase-like protein